MNNLHIYLQTKINELNGAWISKNSGYEKEACIKLGFKCETKRYWDCEYNGSYIEIKKGKSIWLDEVRYCEIFMSDNIDNDELLYSKYNNNILKFLLGNMKIFFMMNVKKKQLLCS